MLQQVSSLGIFYYHVMTYSMKLAACPTQELPYMTGSPVDFVACILEMKFVGESWMR